MAENHALTGQKTAPQADITPPDLASIECELARTEFRVRFRNKILEGAYHAERRARTRLHNRITLGLLTFLFDIFVLAQQQSTPELRHLSLILRFGLLTPAVLAYCFLDWRRLLTTLASPFLTGLIILPAILAAIEGRFVTNPTALVDFQAVPLIQLTVLASRLSLSQSATIIFSASLVYALTILSAGIMPANHLIPLLMTDISIGLAAFALAVRLDLRDRQVFLLGRQADLRGALLTGQNLALERLTQIDALTGLGNRRQFDETLARLWKNSGRPKPGLTQQSLIQESGSAFQDVSLIMFDIDFFKQYNDCFGHQAGDRALKSLALLASGCLRADTDTLVRYGGEEFALIMPATGLTDAIEVAERLRKIICAHAMPHPMAKPGQLLTISAGVASVVPCLETAARLIERADQRLYAAKRAGRNCVVARGGSNVLAWPGTTRRVGE